MHFSSLRAIVLACLVAHGGSVQLAYAAMEHPTVVLKNPADPTPQLVPSEEITRPHVDAIGQVGETVFAAGLFGRVLPSAGFEVTRGNFVAFHATTGALKENPFDPAGYKDPSFDGQVWAIATYGNAVYVGGAFTKVSQNSTIHFRRSLVKLDAATGKVDPLFNANLSGSPLWDLKIWDLKLWHGPNGRTPMLVVGGTMSKKLLALDLATGRDKGYFDLDIIDPIPGAWGGGAAIYRLAINPAGTKLVATGNFRTVAAPAGTFNRTRLFVADLTGPTARLDPWYYPGFAKPCASTHPRRIAYLQGVDFDPAGSYFVVVATGQIPKYTADVWLAAPSAPYGTATYPTVCDGVARFNLTNPSKPVWINYTGGDSVWSVAVTGPAVYVQGHFRWLDNPLGHSSLGIVDEGRGIYPVNRYSIGAIHPVTGKALPWNPPARTDIGGKAFLATSTGLWAGSDNERFGIEPHRGIAFVPLPR